MKEENLCLSRTSFWKEAEHSRSSTGKIPKGMTRGVKAFQDPTVAEVLTSPTLKMLLDRISEHWLLKKCWKKVYEGKSEDVIKSSRGIDSVTIENFKNKEEFYLSELSKKIKSGRFKFNEIKGMAKKKKDGSNRLIAVSTIEDRIVHRAILSVLNEYIYEHINTGVSYCGVKKNFWKKSKTKELTILRAINKIIAHVAQGNVWIFESDIKGFFDCIPKHRMICRIFRILPDASLRQLVREIIRFKIGNPQYLSSKNIPMPDSSLGISQGSSLSPIFGNLYLKNFDLAMKVRFGDRFIRYVDDFVVICKSRKEAESAERFSKNFLQKEGLELSGQKTHVVNLKDPGKSITFLGVRISRSGIFPKKKIGQLRQWLTSEVLNIKKTKRRKTMNKIDLINSKIDGFTNFYKFYHTRIVFDELNEVLSKRRHEQNNLFKNIKNFGESESYEIVSQEKWQNFFKD